MDGMPEAIPNKQFARQIAFGYNFTPFDRQFIDEFKYDSGVRVFTFAIGDKTTNIQFKTTLDP